MSHHGVCARGNPSLGTCDLGDTHDTVCSPVVLTASPHRRRRTRSARASPDAPHTRSSSHLTTPVSTSQVCCCFWRCRPPSSVRRWNSRLVAHLFIAAQRQTLSCIASQMAHTDFLVQSCLEIAQCEGAKVQRRRHSSRNDFCMDANSLWSGSSHSDARDAQPDFLFSACACCTHTAVGSVLHVVLNARYWTCALSGRELVCTRCMKRV